MAIINGDFEFKIHDKLYKDIEEKNFHKLTTGHDLELIITKEGKVIEHYDLKIQIWTIKPHL